MLEVKDIRAGVLDGNGEVETPILKGVSLSVKKGEVHAIMGPNGSGKSTLSKVVSGHPEYGVTGGSILFNGEDIAGLAPDERARKGIFMGFQYPVEIPGVNNAEFLRMAYNARQKEKGLEEADPLDFEEILDRHMRALDMDARFKERAINEGYSGGEKKRNEILQMSILDPVLAILDETDSGLDVDALKIVSEGINRLRSPERAIVLITHYQRLLDYVQPDFVHVLARGAILKSGGKDLALEIEKQGYDWLK
ncbi:MAG TPA: Fe-S cluster assembly ATPase SufC [Fibrobacteria bacterium]|nr:Fe-S cluster assembly ATPase SufC [Fibrobacteria bacterium]